MFRKLASVFGLSAALAGAADAATGPYPDPSSNHLYELLFCDVPALYRPPPGAAAADWQVLLYAPDADVAAVRALAVDAVQESRVRALAYAWLRQRQEPVPATELLGVVVEVALPVGLDTLAAYRDGRVRYLNHGGLAVLIDARTPLTDPLVDVLLAASDRAKPHAQPRQRARGVGPGPGEVRIVMLTSGGLHRIEGPFERLQRDAVVGPALLAASRLLEQLTRAVR
jgi:hypothetical protein